MAHRQIRQQYIIFYEAWYCRIPKHTDSTGSPRVTFGADPNRLEVTLTSIAIIVSQTLTFSFATRVYLFYRIATESDENLKRVRED